MAEVEIHLPHHAYAVRIEGGALDRLGEWTADLAAHERAALVGDDTVLGLYGSEATAALDGAGYVVTTCSLPAGERHKTLETVRRIYDHLLNDRLERRSPLVALGGGVVGDTAGFAAASYLRGIPFVQCPTTLLAMVDASVGGKVGVNVPQGKNLVGAFHQPILVVIDPFVLQTLPPRELRCGLAECVKHGVIRDESLLSFIEDNLPRIQALDVPTMTDLIERNVKIKAAVVMEDEKESGVRAHLNFGHTFAHAIEAVSGYGEVHHGEAVSLGMIAAAHLAVEIGLCDAASARRLTDLLSAIGLPTSAALPANGELVEAMKLDKKVQDDRLRLVLPDGPGHVCVRDDIPTDRVAAAWDVIRQN
ncbi:MAG: 3-dehydroquinate synthase [Phycisphaerae bacterium]|nr:3-dehydroquinate synthase [Phycisphaerae bacterium]